MPPNLRTIRNMELIRVGTWSISSGEWTVAADDLTAAVAAHRAGVLRKPVLKIGHTDPRFDGGPALGRIDNLAAHQRRGHPGGRFRGRAGRRRKPPAALLPSRSVEALIDYTAPDGTVWPLVLTAVALLGQTAPGIETLADLTDLYGVAASSARRVVVAATPAHPEHAMRARAVAVARARRTRAQRLTTIAATPA